MIELRTAERPDGSGLVVELDEALGGEIRQIRADGRPLLAYHEWPSPVPVSRSSSYGDPKLDWLSEYRGGWQTLVPNAGAACTVDDVPLPFHGEWSRTRVDVAERTATTTTFTGASRHGMAIERSIRLLADPLRVEVVTTVENLRDRPVPFVWGEHPAFAVEPGDRIDLPGGSVIDPEHAGAPVDWPGSPSTGDLHTIVDVTPFEAMHVVRDLPGGWAALRRRAVTVALAWNRADYPHAWIWHEIGGQQFPFFGRTSLVAIEPASSWPGLGLAAAVARGQAWWLGAGERRSAPMTLAVLPASARRVVAVALDGRAQFEREQR